MTTAVRRWRLEPHPEGGFYRETYRSGLRTVPPGWPGERALATAILYLLPAGVRSAWHRVRGDELWLWQGGAPMALFIGDEARGRSARNRPRARNSRCWSRRGPGSRPPRGAATPGAAGRGAAEPWSLVACLVAPGFDFADFELRGES